MTSTQQPNREAFIAYWEDYGLFRWRQLLWYFSFLGSLALYVFLVRKVDSDGRYIFASLVLAAAYLVLVPYLTIRSVHTKFARFIRCPQCGDWFGKDVSGAYFGANPKFRSVIQTGRCFRCGAQILSDS